MCKEGPLASDPALLAGPVVAVRLHHIGDEVVHHLPEAGRQLLKLGRDGLLQRRLPDPDHDRGPPRPRIAVGLDAGLAAQRHGRARFTFTMVACSLARLPKLRAAGLQGQDRGPASPTDDAGLTTHGHGKSNRPLENVSGLLVMGLLRRGRAGLVPTDPVAGVYCRMTPQEFIAKWRHVELKERRAGPFHRPLPPAGRGCPPSQPTPRATGSPSRRAPPGPRAARAWPMSGARAASPGNRRAADVTSTAPPPTMPTTRARKPSPPPPA